MLDRCEVKRLSPFPRFYLFLLRCGPTARAGTRAIPAAYANPAGGTCAHLLVRYRLGRHRLLRLLTSLARLFSLAMSLKQELQVWSNALQAFDAQDYGTALARFEVRRPRSFPHLDLPLGSRLNRCSLAPQDIADTSKILFNIALIHATVGQHDQAVAAFDRAIALDSYFAVAYFQSGVSQFLLGRYEAARRDFDDALAVRARPLERVKHALTSPLSR